MEIKFETGLHSFREARIVELHFFSRKAHLRKNICKQEYFTLVPRRYLISVKVRMSAISIFILQIIF